MLEKIIKIFLAILFFLCLLNLSYGFYQLVRFIAMIGFFFLSYKCYRARENTFAVGYVVLALLFQPFLKVALGRDLWNIVDVVVGVGLVISLLMSYSKKNLYNEK